MYQLSRDLLERWVASVMQELDELLGPDDGRPFSDFELVDRCAFCNTFHGQGVVDCPE